MSEAVVETNGPALALRGVRRAFQQAGAPDLSVLDGADLTIDAGEIVALVGPSGSGKSTLLQIAGLLERPDDGEVVLAGQAASGLGDGGRTRMRRRYLGFVYQYHHLLPEFSAEENVIVPQMVAGVGRKAARERARALLDRMGLATRGHHRPGQLSGGEQQRVAIARALANAPRVLLADEPTGNLDPNTADAVFNEFLRLVREEGLAALIATHNPELAARMDRVVTLREGKVVRA
ncbi:ABC transporter ATP-binding protein [Roseospira marina]|uniref:ABC transporter ATP-binding protein n=1 Tax=Roseospira marina TaxID=140057 RepID=A0A5M6IH64_9PROT|nr:ABC transporter ATP-binding protein [Roseospira marina]KAA5607646.1 ABC transporter ATP-binding protein [Roseospira marina]MBB4312153.1 lipoprotein-releasing system ATP-binding protein [Roseospira marina]MBB5085831.1 lipoprotein-releasing system ATP-binding protein [Roseospira marina]